ncbi:Uma2 family endonuclease [Nocardia sp. NPDC057272]|uniref:Uma2 family endonuclease n=1 Tax=Nocardia sp. NPDC057272 TaxID=3346079 RepID=UPI00362A8949
MTNAHHQRPDLPEFMTWEQLEELPEEVAGQIELWAGRVVWLRRGPGEHQEFSNLLWNGLRHSAKSAMGIDPRQCWSVRTETNVFFGDHGRSDFVTPDFMIHRCLGKAYSYVRGDDAVMVGEVLSPSNTDRDIEAKKARYAGAKIPWYWEVKLRGEHSAIESVRIFALESSHGALPAGVRPLHPANYLLVGEWTPKDSDGIHFDHPFVIDLSWADLEFLT